ncbi:MAG: LysR family transcriptional regulator [Rhizobiales bacterium]|nr:LysR family transcriptional regulator [Hyphomicrobiales bacterium]
MDRFESMSVYAAIVEEGGFSAAARKLRMPVATVSRKLSELEAYLKVQLLTRTTRKVTATQQGEQFYRDCRRILSELAEAERTAAGEYGSPRGELVVTAPLVFGRLHVMPVVNAFLAAYREITIRLVFSDRILSLQDEHLDVAVRIGELPASTMKAMRIGEVTRIVCAAPKYIAKNGMPLYPRELAGHDCVAFSNMDGPEGWDFREEGNVSRYPVKARMIVNSAEAAINAAIAGTGITRVLSYQAAAALRNGSLERLLAPFEPEPLPVSLAYQGGKAMAQKLRAFIDFAAPRIKARLQAVSV